MFSELKPINDNILVKREVQQEDTQGGIYMSAVNNEKSNIGIVIAAGSGKHVDGQLVHTKVKVGHRVYFPKFGGVELDEEYVMLREDNILGHF